MESFFLTAAWWRKILTNKTGHWQWPTLTNFLWDPPPPTNPGGMPKVRGSKRQSSTNKHHHDIFFTVLNWSEWFNLFSFFSLPQGIRVCGDWFAIFAIPLVSVRQACMHITHRAPPFCPTVQDFTHGPMLIRSFDTRCRSVLPANQLPICLSQSLSSVTYQKLWQQLISHWTHLQRSVASLRHAGFWQCCLVTVWVGRGDTVGDWLTAASVAPWRGPPATLPAAAAAAAASGMPLNTRPQPSDTISQPFFRTCLHHR